MAAFESCNEVCIHVISFGYDSFLISCLLFWVEYPYGTSRCRENCRAAVILVTVHFNARCCAISAKLARRDSEGDRTMSQDTRSPKSHARERLELYRGSCLRLSLAVSRIDRKRGAKGGEGEMCCAFSFQGGVKPHPPLKQQTTPPTTTIE